MIGYLPGYLNEEGYDDGSRSALRLRCSCPARSATLVAALLLAVVAVLVLLAARPGRPWAGQAVDDRHRAAADQPRATPGTRCCSSRSSRWPGGGSGSASSSRCSLVGVLRPDVPLPLLPAARCWSGRSPCGRAGAPPGLAGPRFLRADLTAPIRSGAGHRTPCTCTHGAGTSTVRTVTALGRPTGRKDVTCVPVTKVAVARRCPPASWSPRSRAARSRLLHAAATPPAPARPPRPRQRRATPTPGRSIPTLGGVDTAGHARPGFVDGAHRLKLTPGVIGTATLSKAGVLTFPITGGNVDVLRPHQTSARTCRARSTTTAPASRSPPAARRSS